MGFFMLPHGDEPGAGAGPEAVGTGGHRVIHDVVYLDDVPGIVHLPDGDIKDVLPGLLVGDSGAVHQSIQGAGLSAKEGVALRTATHTGSERMHRISGPYLSSTSGSILFFSILSIWSSPRSQISVFTSMMVV